MTRLDVMRIVDSLTSITVTEERLLDRLERRKTLVEAEGEDITEALCTELRESIRINREHIAKWEAHKESLP